MFTAVYPPISDIKDEIARRRLVKIKFEDVAANRELTKEFSFGIYEELVTMKKAFNQYLDELNFVPPPITDLAPVAEPVLTQAEKDRAAWLYKHAKWVRIKTTLIDTGIIPATNPKAQAMIDDLKTTLKAEYIDFI